MTLAVDRITTFAGAPPPAEWEALLRRSDADSVFMSRAFQETWWRVFCCCDCTGASCCCQLEMLLLRDGGTLVGVAPFYLTTVSDVDWAAEQVRARDWARIVARAQAVMAGEKAPDARTAQMASADPPAEPPPPAPRPGERVLRLLGGVEVADYLDLLVVRGCEEEAWSAVMDYWAAHGADWDVIDLHSLQSGAAARARHAAARAGCPVWEGVEETCPAVPLPASWEDYLAALGKKDRHELRRKLRRTEERAAPPTWTVTSDAAALPAAAETFLELHRLSGAAKAEFMSTGMERFFRELVAAFAASGRLEIATMIAEDKPVASYLSFRDGRRLLLYNSGYDPAVAELGAGFALLVYRLQAAIGEGYTACDFLRGDERYKYDLGATDRFINRVIIRK